MNNSSMTAKKTKNPTSCCSVLVTPAQDLLKVPLLKTGEPGDWLSHLKPKQNSKFPSAGAVPLLTHSVTGLSVNEQL